MSGMQTRKDLALKLSGIPDITGYEEPPKTLKPGDAWPLWGGSVNSGAQFDHTWRIVVFVGSTESAAIAFLDFTLDVITAALEDTVYVESAFPSTVTVDGNSTHVVELRGRSE